MNIIKELIQMVPHHRIKRLDLLDKGMLLNKKTKVTQLYFAVKNGQIQTDEEAHQLLYPKGPYNAYSKLKQSLINMIINNIYFVDLKSTNFSNYKKAWLDGYRNVLLIEILAAFGLRNIVKRIGRKTLNKASRYPFNDIIMPVARILKSYAATEGDVKELALLTDAFNKAKTGHDHETTAETYFQAIASYYGRNLSSGDRLLKEAQVYINELENINLKNQSFEFLRYYYNLKALYAFIKKEYLIAIQQYSALEKMVQNNKLYYQGRIIASVNRYKLSCYMHLPNHDKEAQHCITICQQYYKKGKNNWFAFNELYLQYLMRKNAYQEAYDLYRTVTNHAKFRRQAPERKEKWMIFDAYLHFLIEAGAINTKLGSAKTFNLEKFKKNITLLKKDHRGYHLTILIIEILFYVARKKRTQLFEMVPYLQSFRSRHLRQKEDIRSKAFLSLLIKLAQARLSYNKHRSKFVRQQNVLKDNGYHNDGINNNPEIIPYEKLWDISLSFVY